VAIDSRPDVMAPAARRRFRWRGPAVIAVAAFALWAGAAAYYRLGAFATIENLSRVAADPILARVYADDVRTAGEMRHRYWIGDAALFRADAVRSWRRLENAASGFRLTDLSGAGPIPLDVPFVFESPDAPYLRELDRTFNLQQVVGERSDEYAAMLRLGAWVGGLFDHGSDRLSKAENRITPVEIIRAGQNGRKFWCEIAARLTVQAATAMGWQARLVSASRDGYTWEHAVAELWSNQFRKWFVIDADFNVVYESRGVPLSAFELCHRGPTLQRERALEVRQIAPPKPSLPATDLLPYYGYVHIDLRNDWNSRYLPRGSPAGSDRNTWWTARPEFGHVLTAKVRVDDEATFDWPSNVVSLHARELVTERSGARQLRLGLVAYSPRFRTYAVQLDDGAWEEDADGDLLVPLQPGRHVIRARVITARGYPGPVYSVSFTLLP
jgi:hypothetical protein